MIKLAPIILFVYNRKDHTEKTIEALKKNDLAGESELFIYSDAAKNTVNFDAVEEVREYIKTVNGFKSVTIIERVNNMGLAKSVILGVSEIINKYGKVIVLEDDLITAPQFLKYMNKNLENYEEVEEVISIHGYNYPVKTIEKHFFLKGADCWGWATWKRGWDLFEENGEKLLKELKDRGQIWEFNYNNSYNYSGMLEDFINGKNSSWAVRWYASAFLKDKYTLYPGKSLVKNIGLDNTGIHSGKQIESFINNKEFPKLEYIDKVEIIENNEAKVEIEKYFKRMKWRSKFYMKVFYKLLKILWG